MHITFTTEEAHRFRELVDRFTFICHRSIGKNSGCYIRIRTAATAIFLEATSPVLSLKAQVDGTVIDPGEAVVPLKMALSLFRQGEASPMMMFIDPVKADSFLKVSDHEGVRHYDMRHVIPFSLVSNTQAEPTAIFPGSLVKKFVKHVGYAADTKEDKRQPMIRYMEFCFTGYPFLGEGDLRVRATDSFQFASEQFRVKMPHPGNHTLFLSNGKLARAAKAFQGCKEVMLFHDKDEGIVYLVSHDPSSFTCTFKIETHEGAYPNLDVMLEKAAGGHIRIDRKDLIDTAETIVYKGSGYTQTCEMLVLRASVGNRLSITGATDRKSTAGEQSDDWYSASSVWRRDETFPAQTLAGATEDAMMAWDATYTVTLDPMFLIPTLESLDYPWITLGFGMKGKGLDVLYIWGGNDSSSSVRMIAALTTRRETVDAGLHA